MGKRLKGAGWGIIVTLITMGAIGIVGGVIAGGVWFVAQAGKWGGGVGAFAAWVAILCLCSAVLGAVFDWGND